MGLVLTAACGCDTGRVRRQNQDNFYFDGQILSEQNNGTEQILTACRNTAQGTVDFGVFDGMGGHAEGQKASYMAAAVFSDSVEQNRADHEQMLRETVMRMSASVWRRAEEEYNNMGTTAAVLRFSENTCYLANVGDSRIFLFRSGGLQQISRDHTEEEIMKKMGITGRKPRLTQYVGMPPDVTIDPYIYRTGVADADQFLICSDGLTDMVSPENIAAVLAMKEDVSAKVRELIRQAMENGGKDNTTVLLIEVSAAGGYEGGADLKASAAGDSYAGEESFVSSKAGRTSLKVILAVAVAVALIAGGALFYTLVLSGKKPQNTDASTAKTSETTGEEQDAAGTGGIREDPNTLGGGGRSPAGTEDSAEEQNISDDGGIGEVQGKTESGRPNPRKNK